MSAQGKFKIKGKNLPNYDSEIEVDIGANADNHEVTEKPIPEPTPYGDGTIVWFAAFAVKERVNGAFANIPYTVTLNALPKGKKLFVLLENVPQEITYAPTGSGKIKFNLAIGDPPIGWGP